MPKRGSKGNLPPRVPARKISKLFVEKKLPDGTKRRVSEHQNFATPDVVKALEAGGWKRRLNETADQRRLDETADRIEVRLGPSELDEIPDGGDISNKIPNPDPDPSEIVEIFVEHDLSNDIGNVVKDYISKAQYQIAPKKFRPEAKLFHKAITRLGEKFPAPESALAEALNNEIEKLADELAYEGVGNIEHCRIVVRALREASERVQADEAGAGPDADRAKHEFFVGLARIYEERTGRRPARAFDPSEGKPIGPFFEFVTAVNALIPKSLRLTDSYIDRLTGAYFPSN
jgi:hypothetical protein